MIRIALLARTLVVPGFVVLGLYAARPAEAQHRHADAQIIRLDFNSLPSAQGWTFASDGTPETAVFSVGNGLLTQNTVARPDHSWYQMLGVVNPAGPFAIGVRARVLQYSGDPANAFGFCFAASTGTEEFLVGIATDRISHGGHNQVPLDGTVFHDYILAVLPGVGYSLFVDGRFVASGPPLSSTVADIGPNRLLFGDCTRGAGALAEITRFNFTQIVGLR